MSETTKQEPMSDDERLAHELNEAYRCAGGDDFPESWENYSERLKRAALVGLAKARTLLAPPLVCEPLTIEEKRRIADSSSSPFVVAHDAALAQYKKCRPAPSPLPSAEELAAVIGNELRPGDTAHAIATRVLSFLGAQSSEGKPEAHRPKGHDGEEG